MPFVPNYVQWWPSLVVVDQRRGGKKHFLSFGFGQSQNMAILLSWTPTDRISKSEWSTVSEEELSVKRILMTNLGVKNKHLLCLSFNIDRNLKAPETNGHFWKQTSKDNLALYSYPWLTTLYVDVAYESRFPSVLSCTSSPELIMSTGAVATAVRRGAGGGSAILTSCKAIQHPEEETTRHLPSPGMRACVCVCVVGGRRCCARESRTTALKHENSHGAELQVRLQGH